MNTYIVVEEAFDAELLARLIDKNVKDTAEIAVGGSKSSASSLARTLLATRHKPVALMVDADTNTPNAIKEKQQSLEELLQLANSMSPFKVILTVPELEIIFFQDSSAIADILEVNLTNEDLITARFLPKQVLENLFQRNSVGIRNKQELLASLGNDVLTKLAKHPTVQELNEFLLSQSVNDSELQIEAA